MALLHQTVTSLRNIKMFFMRGKPSVSGATKPYTHIIPLVALFHKDALYQTICARPGAYLIKTSKRQLSISRLRQGAGVKNIEINEKNIKSFENVAKKYGVDFALKKNPEKGEYYVFFKARDDDAMQAAFAEYTAKTVQRKAPEKPSVLQQLSHFKEVARSLAQDTAKNREKGGHEL